jgi:hypothetical protein
MKKLLFIGPKFHEKTGSTKFIINLLAPVYAIDFCSVDVVKGAKDHGLSKYSAESYDVLLCFQVMLSPIDLKWLSFRSGVFFPMYDGCPSPRKTEKWFIYRDFKIISFSRKLYQGLINIGMSAEYIQYFPEPVSFDNYGCSNGVYLWNRREEIGLDCLYVVTSKLDVCKVHVHKVLDPTQEFMSCDGASNVSLTYSDWYDQKEDMLSDVCKYAYYMAPRAREGIGMSFLEAMAAGRCVIAPNESTMNEYITDGVNGCLYDLKCPKPVEVINVLEIQNAAAEYMKEGYDRWMIERAQIIRWMGSSSRVNLWRFTFWMSLRFFKSPIKVVRTLLQACF